MKLPNVPEQNGDTIFFRYSVGNKIRKWKITHCRFKLGLKYGLCGQWLHNPPHQINSSLAFDLYTSNRSKGTNSDMPLLGDLSATIMMNSRLSSSGATSLYYGLFSPFTSDSSLQALQAWRMELRRRSYRGLADMPRAMIHKLSDIVWNILNSESRHHSSRGVSIATMFKWLSAWAPSYVPMLDKFVYYAIMGWYPTRHEESRHISQAILHCKEELTNVDNKKTLAYLADWLSKQIRNTLSLKSNSLLAISELRILDNLIWFDWAETPALEFKRYFEFNSDGKPYRITRLGLKEENTLIENNTL